MKYDIMLKQQAMIDHNLNVTQFAILDLIAAASTWAECIIINKEVYYWTSRTMIVDELEALDLKPDTVYRNLKQLAKNGLIDFKKKGKQDCSRLTPKAKSIFRETKQKKRESPYVGNKSEKGEFTMSEKNPRKLGKKSEKDSEKNPTYHSTNIHPPTNDSSSSSPPKMENATVVFDAYSVLPEEIEGLPRSVIIEEVEAIAKERGGDFEKYRDALVKEILSGNGRTITNIRIRRSRINKREHGEMLQAALQANGYANIFDYLEDAHGRANENIQ